MPGIYFLVPIVAVIAVYIVLTLARLQEKDKQKYD